MITHSLRQWLARTSIVRTSLTLIIFIVLLGLTIPLVGGTIPSGPPSAAGEAVVVTPSDGFGSDGQSVGREHESSVFTHRLGTDLQAPPQNVTTAQSNPSRHRLVIRGLNQRATYSVQTSGPAIVSKTERTDASRTSTVTGLVGPNDSIDIIHFTGHITLFSTDGNLRVTVDGHSVDPTVLDGHYIQFEPTPQSPTPVNYTFTVSGAIEPTQLAERTDISAGLNTSHVAGTLTATDTDAFYYTGEITRSTVSGPLTVTIDGKVVPVDSDTTPSGSPPSSRETSATTPTATQRSATSHSPTATPVVDTTLPYQVSNLSVRPSTTEVNTKVTVTVRVSNTGTTRVDAPLELATSGTIVASQRVTLFPGEWQRITFIHEYKNPGNYTIRIGQLNKHVSIVAEGTLDHQQGGDSDTLAFWILVAGVIGTGGALVWSRLQ